MCVRVAETLVPEVGEVGSSVDVKSLGIRVRVGVRGRVRGMVGRHE